ncbi:hypothetical protein GCM10010289_82280 [Streptomyces violascens]|uniref:Transposase n=1 Tax=Streptomyces violascens TaxID=67381 RepID=A0ABQ3QQY8_9ACTN|nr:hypothetical protein GCM10010289_82280 [Streptomyces violascens]GHI39654.1 hypothetical protein Sviol_40620 [Streptomyces violascens]
MANDLPKRHPRDGAAELEAAVTRREFFRLTPEECPLPQWLKLPPRAVPTRTTVTPTRSVLGVVEAALLRRLGE